jgi:hypothetical protein
VLARATIVRIDYEGVVSGTTGNGAGYAVGDHVLGFLEIDTSASPSDNNPAPNVGSYSATFEDFISGSYPVAGRSIDWVSVADRYLGFRDEFVVQNYGIDYQYRDGANTISRNDYALVRAEDDTIDFTHGDTPLQTFYLTSAQNLYAEFRSQVVTFSPGGLIDSTDGSAFAPLSRLSVQVVPLPASCVLLATGLLSLLGMRRRDPRFGRSLMSRDSTYHHRRRLRDDGRMLELSWQPRVRSSA